jgi:uncharacterized protein YceH (UPF0502 family)
VRLSPEEARVVGSLVEKQLTTPQQYPLTLNSLVLACNQSSNRDPVVEYEPSLVELALSSLKDAGLVRFVYPSHGRSVTRYRQVVDERLAMDREQIAILAILLLRGPQTAAELRARSERMASFDGPGAVEATLRGMSEGPEPLVIRLTRRPGQKEERWGQLVADEPDRPEPRWESPGPAGDGRGTARPPDRAAAFEEHVTAIRAEMDELRAGLEEQVTAIRAEVEELRDAFDHVRRQLGA